MFTKWTDKALIRTVRKSITTTTTTKMASFFLVILLSQWGKDEALLRTEKIYYIKTTRSQGIPENTNEAQNF